MSDSVGITAPAGAPPAGGADGQTSGATSTPTTETGPASERSRSERILERVRQLREPTYGQRDPQGRFAPGATGQPPTATAENAEEAASRQPDAGESDASDDAPKAKTTTSDDGKEPKDAPPWLAKRLERERGKFAEKTTALQGQLSAVQGQLNAVTLEHSQTREALRVAAQEIEALRERLRSGQPYDPRDDELGDLRLLHQVKETRERLSAEHQQRLQQQQEDAQIESAADEVRQEVEGALATHPAVSRAELLAAMRADGGRTHASKLAAKLHSDRIAALRAAGLVGAPVTTSQAPTPAPMPRTPQTARTSSAAAGVTFPNTPEGRLAFVRQQRGSQR